MSLDAALLFFEQHTVGQIVAPGIVQSELMIALGRHLVLEETDQIIQRERGIDMRHRAWRRAEI